MTFTLFDRLEDKARRWFSRRPILYGVIGGVGIVLFWRGVWHTADTIMFVAANYYAGDGTIDLTSGLLWWDGPLSLLVGFFLLLLVGLFVSSFIGNEIIISGLRGEKKVSEKTEQEIKAEFQTVTDIRRELAALSDKIDSLKR
jgi:hypothetical protein